MTSYIKETALGSICGTCPAVRTVFAKRLVCQNYELSIILQKVVITSCTMYSNYNRVAVYLVVNRRYISYHKKSWLPWGETCLLHTLGSQQVNILYSPRSHVVNSAHA